MSIATTTCCIKEHIQIHSIIDKYQCTILLLLFLQGGLGYASDQQHVQTTPQQLTMVQLSSYSKLAVRSTRDTWWYSRLEKQEQRKQIGDPTISAYLATPTPSSQRSKRTELAEAVAPRKGGRDGVGD